MLFERNARLQTTLVRVVLVALCALALVPATAMAEDSKPTLAYNSLEELAGKDFAYVNGSVYNLMVQDKIEGTTESFYPSLPDCVAAVTAGKADAAVQLSSGCELAVNRSNGTVGLLPEPVANVVEGYFFPQGSELTDQFNKVIAKLDSEGVLDKLREKWVSADDTQKTVPEQDWDAPNGTLKFATTGVLEPLSYIGEGGQPIGYDIELALNIAKELGYHLDISTITMDAIIASVQAGKVDFGGTLTRTDERAESVDFSDSVMPMTISVIVKVEGAGTGATNGGETSKTDFFGGLVKSFEKTFIEENRWQLIVEGLGVTILISVCSGVLGTLLGFFTVLQRRNGGKLAAKLVNGFQALMGGVPLVVVLMVLYYVVFGSFDIDGKIVAIIAFTLAFGSTAGTTMWTAVSGLDIIQEECGLALGYTPRQTFKKIIFPQAAQQFMPQLVGQFVSLVKDTSIVGFIAVQDLTRAGDLIRARTMDAFFPLIATAIIYFIICRLLALVLKKVAARVDVTNKPRTVEGVEL